MSEESLKIQAENLGQIISISILVHGVDSSNVSGDSFLWESDFFPQKNI